jgi:hypothetical protein
LAGDGGDLPALEVDDELLLDEDDELLLDEDDELLLDEDDELLLEELSLDELLLLEELLLDELLLEELLLLPLPFVGATFSPGGLLFGDTASAFRASPPGPPLAVSCRSGSDLPTSLLDSFFSPARRGFVFTFFLLLGVCPFRVDGTGSFVPVANASSTLVVLLVVPETAAATLGFLEALFLLLVVMAGG